MATFRIHQDSAIKDAISKKENISKIPKKFIQNGKRTALNCFTNGVRQDCKRIKIISNKENVPPPQTKPIPKIEEKPKLVIDTDLLKIVAGGSKTSDDKDQEALPLLKALKCSIEYSEEILKCLKEQESEALPRADYMEKQPHITWTMRSVLVDWLACVADEYNLSEDTLYLAVNYIDRFLSKISVIREKLQLVGASAMLIAGKMEEIYPPMPKEWAFLTSDSYTTRQVIKMEQLIIKVLDFKLVSPTSYMFVRKFCEDHKFDKITTNLAMYLTELVLLEGDHYLNFKPSEIAAASILSARFNLMKPVLWPKDIEKSSGYTIKHLSPIVKAQSATLKDSPHKAQQTIQEKYKGQKFSRVALLKPRVLKMDCLSPDLVDDGFDEIEDDRPKKDFGAIGDSRK
ncbi:G2/mitotic-specific cyclin-A-like [Coccinella septempunctata]|uniref:G2/mitotic-specific cyclin-A-like n=1 Tax=Coccinella septempunctata TaxID=41139 RepID=UPI001D096530|nr:G2/mitotic-specific cyclin-A-like [Coccinella septempunctata]